MPTITLLFIFSLMANAMMAATIYVKNHELQRIRRMYRDACAGFIPFNMWEADDENA